MIDYVGLFIGAYIMGFALFYGIGFFKSIAERIV
ncbi:gene IX product [Lineavirus I22]|uniref:Tail virion protein G9P n=1 Tax=Enterobacteria phage I2-2 TaxID=10869 RepID=G9P_BPI22|nr:gene IX product [Lineavirus I22]P15414.1 RecName: Full=Tail virion protein G9P; AltName: Full=Coat protein C, polypeptide II; AltName: Full=G9P [Lineavirus I22]EAA7785182.1 phage coat protein [Salmonella enterica]RXJ25593.1 phage coat protein [Escherichia coli]EAU1702681.1 phage coat protein [Salmonella enterica]CAA32516.1 gene IX product [Lineavirus I22]